MRIEPHRNLTVTLIRRNQFSTLRYAGSVPRRPIAQNMHLAQRLKICPPGPALASAVGRSGLGEPQQAWPYDSPMPAGLQRLVEGQPLQTAASPDNRAAQMIRPEIQSPARPLTDANPSRLDVLA